jgi:hypothetical protein
MWGKLKKVTKGNHGGYTSARSSGIPKVHLDNFPKRNENLPKNSIKRFIVALFIMAPSWK